ncbi:MAG: hypothetical protein H0W61_02825 [Bacteroidetes bacterium]|nr:hypothetical protein [Bacteroidota bacterium]
MIYLFQYNPLKVLPLVILALTATNLRAQYYNLPNEYSFSLLTEKRLAARDSATHTGIKPYIHFFSDKYVQVSDTHRIFKYIVDDPALDVAFYKHLIRIQPHGQNFKFTLDPILNIDVGNDYYDSLKTQTSTNTRGFIGCGYIGNKVYFETMFAESQSFFPQYLNGSINATSVVPGQGRWKQFKKTGYDYAFSSGFISYQPLKNLNIQVGHGKQKIGYGYRSLLLSDNAFNYPYAKVTQQWFKGRVQYSNIYAVLMNLVGASAVPNPNAERLFQKKASSFQYLSINPAKFLNIGFFQGMIWEAGDSKNRQHLDWQYFNPIIYTNLAQFGLNNKNNILIGGDIRFKITSKINIYGQVMADDLSNTKKVGNGIGYQAGLNYFDVLGIKNLFLQTEYNFVNEGSYSGPIGAITNQSYSHYNQGLTYTPGYGQEVLVMMDYKFKRMFLNARYQNQVVPVDGAPAYETQIVSAKLGYLVNPAYNLNVALGYTYRNQKFSNFNTSSNQTNYIYLALRTSIYNLYYDF